MGPTSTKLREYGKHWLPLAWVSISRCTISTSTEVHMAFIAHRMTAG